MQKLTMRHLAQQLDGDLTPLNHDLVDRGIITEAELETARLLQQSFYNPRRNRFATVQHSEVVYLEPPRHERERLTPCLPRAGQKTKTVKKQYDEFWASYIAPSPKRFD